MRKTVSKGFMHIGFCTFQSFVFLIKRELQNRFISIAMSHSLLYMFINQNDIHYFLRMCFNSVNFGIIFTTDGSPMFKLHLDYQYSRPPL